MYELPGRKAIGKDVGSGEMKLCEKGWAVAAFIPPAYTGLYLAAYESAPDAPTLPLFCYTAAGWYNDNFYVPAIRIEKDIRQEAAGYDDLLIREGVRKMISSYPHNRLLNHLSEKCCLAYHCPAARNFFRDDGNAPCPPRLHVMQIAWVAFHFNRKMKVLFPRRTGSRSNRRPRRLLNSLFHIFKRHHFRLSVSDRDAKENRYLCGTRYVKQLFK